MDIGRWIATAFAAAFSASLLMAAAPSGAPAVEARWIKAVKANDVDALVACYAPDAVLWAPGEAEARGAEAIRAAYARILADNVVKDAVITSAQYRDFGNFSAGWGSYSLTLVPRAGGAPIEMRGRFTEVVEKRNGKWLYVADHASADPAPAPPPAR